MADTSDTTTNANEYRARLARMASDLSLRDALRRAKGWISDDLWLPGPDLKDVLRCLVEAVETNTVPPPMAEATAAPLESRQVPEKRPPGRPRKVGTAKSE